MSTVKSWLRENYFLGGLVIMIFTVTAYVVKLETRMTIVETRGAEYTANRLVKVDERLTVLEQSIIKNGASIERIIDVMTRELGKKP